MADQDSIQNLLADLLEGRTVAQAVGGEAASLAMLARRIERVTVPGPSPASVVRVRTRVTTMMEGRGTGRPWLAGWLGGTAARPLRERMAAGALLFAVASGSASVATGVSPVEFVSGVGDFARSVVVNLTPGDSSGENSAPSPEASPSQATGVPGAATVQGQTATPGSTGTPEPTPAANGSTGPSPSPISSTTPIPSTATPSPTGTPPPTARPVAQPPTPPGPQQTTTPIPSPSGTSTPDAPDDSANRTRTPEPGDDSGGGNSGSGSSGSGSSGSGNSGSGNSGSGSSGSGSNG